MFGISELGLSSYYQHPYTAHFSVGSTQRNAAAQGAVRTAVIPVAQPEVPVQPVPPVTASDAAELDQGELIRLWENDPAAMAVRSRIQYVGNEQPTQSSAASIIFRTAEQVNISGAAVEMNVPGTVQTGRSGGTLNLGADAVQGVELSGFVQAEQIVTGSGQKERTQGSENKLFRQLEENGAPGHADEDSESKTAREVMEESECQTCKNRKYQDGSDDPGVSFKSPTHIDPDMAESEVRGHEMEHVVRNRAAAQREGRKVVSQSVTYYTAICPECGRVYVSGGTTRTSTAAETEETCFEQQREEEEAEKDSTLIVPVA